ncbi:MAG: DUF1919 domain-containing protein [Selenomonadaceae bacterium]|nr:DUF1919 domain-containing protein [Selenomonadaceae bacterium]
MLKVLVWQVSNDTSFKDKAIKILEQQHNGIEIVGEAVNENIAKVDGGGQYDVLLCVGAKKFGMSKITADAHKLNLPEEKLLGDWIVCIPGFTLEKYRHLQRSQLSIISKNCFGGFISNLMGLPFRSPFINMTVRDERECIVLYRNLHSYIHLPPVLKGTQFEHILKFDYPIYRIVDVDIHMNHYRDFDEALAKWNERKQRINWDNLFVMMFTDKKEILEQFDELPYGKKVCFVSFKSNLPSAWYLNPKIAGDNYLWEAVNHFGMGRTVYYDPFDMLLYGKKTPLIDM